MSMMKKQQSTWRHDKEEGKRNGVVVFYKLPPFFDYQFFLILSSISSFLITTAHRVKNPAIISIPLINQNKIDSHNIIPSFLYILLILYLSIKYDENTITLIKSRNTNKKIYKNRKNNQKGNQIPVINNIIANNGTQNITTKPFRKLFQVEFFRLSDAFEKNF